MLWTEFIQEEREEARAEGRAEGQAEGVIAERCSMIFEILADISGEFPEGLKQALQEIKDPDLLLECFRKARKVTTIEEFCEWMKNI